MKKLFLVFFLSLSLLFLFFLPIAKVAGVVPTGLVPCGNTIDPATGAGACQLSDLFTLILNIYNFIVLISTALAALLIVLGGAIIVVSGGPGGKNPVTGAISPNMYSTAKSMLTGAVMGLLLVFGSWVIVNAVLVAIGYTGAWNIFPT